MVWRDLDGVDGVAGWIDLVDAIEDLLAEDDVGGGELRFELLHGAWPDETPCARIDPAAEGNRDQSGQHEPHRTRRLPPTRPGAAM
jgi:hypothetical protein